MKKKSEWIIGLRANPESIREYLKPKEITNGKSVHFEKGYHWLWWYFYKIRRCDRCGAFSCGKGLIRYWSSDRSKVLAHLCIDCAKMIPETKNAGRKHCRRCNFQCDIHDMKKGLRSHDSKRV